jgi:hypothetical protein
VKIKYLDRNWEAVGEKEVSPDYLLPDKVVCNYQHIAEIRPDEKLSFLDTIHVGPFEDIVEFKNGFEQIFFIDVGKVLKNSFNISLFFEKIDNDSNGLAKILNKEMVENIEPDTLIPENCAGIEIDILTVDYGMIFIHIPQYKSESYTLESLLETAKKIDHFFFTIFQEINEIGEGVIPLIPSYAYNMKKGKIFISHASKDKVFARKLRDSLRSENLDTWFDEDDILVGDDFVESIEKGLIESDYIVIVLSPNFNNGPWATKEYRAALTEQINNGKIKILPVKYKECTPPLLLNSISHADLSKNFDGGLKQLVRTIHRRYFKENVDKTEI